MEVNMDTKILLENGTNELEILEFTLGDNSYGINVAKVREIITYQPVTPVPNSHPSIEGIFMPRDIMITAIDLKNCLGRGESEPKGLFILTNFNKLDLAFHVDSVLGIHRVSWRDIIKPDATISTTDESVSTGIIKKDGKLIIILDFEKIVSDINPGNIRIGEDKKAYYIDILNAGINGSSPLATSKILLNYIRNVKLDTKNVTKELDRITMMMLIFETLFNKEFYYITYYEYMSRAEKIKTLMDLVSYYEVIRTNQKNIDMPYLHEIISDCYVKKYKKEMR